MDEDSKGQRELEDTGGGLLPAVEGHSPEYNRIEKVPHGDLLYAPDARLAEASM